MSADDGIDDRTKLAQATATNPVASAWVSANAGSGKTFVLARRVIRLLLAGTDPSCILCLTFTKAAAAEMARRTFSILGEWTTLSDADLAVRIAEIEGRSPRPTEMARARRLFAQALDTPGGLKIQTIHAFCERLLHQFPFEANVAGHFEVLDEREEKALKEEAVRLVMARADREPEGEIGKALAAILPLVSDFTHQRSLAEFIDTRDEIGGWIVQAGNVGNAISQLRNELGVERTESIAAARDAAMTGCLLSVADARRLIDLLLASGPNDQKAADRLLPFVEKDDPAVRLDALKAFFFTENGEERSLKSLVSKGVKTAWPGLEELLEAEMARLAAVLDRIRLIELYESSAAMLRLADAAFAEYDKRKRARGLLDFEDLVIRTAMLLARSDAARWVHYKLDRGIEHILVDEAQDTSPRQWQVIRTLADEFFAGAGASDKLRTLFAVGDEKQSIFSFQGAVPAWFSRVAREAGAKARAASYLWENVELHLSFRSVPKVLEAVDQVFKAPDVHRGLAADLKPTVHEARRRKDKGRVIVWPRYEKPEKAEYVNWYDPLDHLGDASPEVQLAKRIAKTIRGWLDRGEILDAPDKDGKPKPIRPGGILILARSRGALTDAINRELKRKDIAIAGADRVTLTEHIAVMDLMAAGRVALLPDDDLTLAALLKSPLIGLDEDALFALAHGRERRSLWSALTEKASERAEFAAARDKIERWRRDAELLDPHAFFARILGPERGRAAFLHRLGAEAEDVIDEFVAQTLAYEKTNVPSLEGFLDWLVAGDTEIKRDSESLRDEVRVMTVHGAKGLEADIVFLVDNGMAPHAAGAHDPKALPLDEVPDPLAPGPVVWMRSVKAMPTLAAEKLAAWRLRAEEEYRRLLYVGMTRAKDRLYVVGISKQNLKDDNRWHALVSRALQPEWVDQKDGEDIAYEWRPSGDAPPAGAATSEAGNKRVLPAWAETPAPPPSPAPKRLTPSTALGATPVVPAILLAHGDAPANLALDRGKLIHRLLQSLPDIAIAEREAIGARYLVAFAEKWEEGDRAKLLAETLAILAHPDFAPVFAEGSRAEVDIAGRIDGAIVSGRVDRLVVTPDRVLIVDYKTNRPAPADVPREYVAQLALYRAVLRRLYPGREIAAAILWTDRPALVEIPEKALILAESSLVLV